ncbi:hypothetical protein B296_00049276 [Ensete ventricosum]|uniref:Uncharacterized protein n=1 Tax=Ensete ventricosum TaxID=4639 RepID=A0A426X3J9_ENSVE|nr:hypothetical protein B296_00049276 [Ensete ventricosum]
MHRVNAVGNSPGVRRKHARVSGACQDSAREFTRRRPRLVGRLSGVAEKLAGNNRLRSSLSIGSGFGRCGGFRWEFAKRFAEGIEKLTGNTSGNHRGEDQKTCCKYTRGFRIGRS